MNKEFYESHSRWRIVNTKYSQGRKKLMNNKTLLAKVPVDLLYQALETEKGGVQVYTTALRCALNKDLREEWNKYLEQTKTHVQVVSELLTSMDLDLETETPGRKIVRHIG